MKIKFLENSSFIIESEGKKIYINPEKEPTDASLVLFSYFEKGADFELKAKINWPGEFEYNEIAVKAYNPRGEKIIHSFDLEGIRIGFLGELKKLISQEKLESFMDTDILIIPKYQDGISDKDLKKLAEEIDPRIIILSGEDALFEGVFRELGNANPERTKEFEISKSKLPSEHTLHVLLERE
ncbi:MAG: MBL fold metallo-hydrolase [Candidatus Gracilibacteria bacterium]|jgi:L-ascorbate metabolism protein UlaG (beta-lactamase superfamily)|nr:MBL fold metallo-hydrolase [Candidatus Gracilibacteria bacterium]